MTRAELEAVVRRQLRLVAGAGPDGRALELAAIVIMANVDAHANVNAAHGGAHAGGSAAHGGAHADVIGANAGAPAEALGAQGGAGG